MNHVLEIRSCQLKPGTRQEFHRLFLEEAFPLLQRWDVDVIAYGPSLHDQDSYYSSPGRVRIRDHHIFSTDSS